MTAPLRPVLKGVLGEEGTGKTVWEGVWCMRQDDFATKALTAPFRYVRTGTAPERAANAPATAEASKHGFQDGYFSGSFEVRSATSPASTTRFSEKNVLIRFCDGEEPGSVRVEGSGSNKLGKFTLKGSLDVKSREMTVVREYALRKKPRNPRSQARVQRELDLGTSALATPQPRRQVVAGERPTSRAVGALMQRMRGILDELVAADTNKWFCSPVNAEALGLLDYHTIIAEPMDLGTVLERFTSGQYATPQEMRRDIELTFSNAIHYNPRGHNVYKVAVQLQELFAERFQVLMSEPSASEISTPDAPPSFRRIGKRHSIPKVHFEPSPHGRVHGSSQHQLSPDSGEGTPRKRRKRQGDDAQKELDMLRDQVEQMRQHITSLSGNMAVAPAGPMVPEASAPRATGAVRQPSFDSIRRLGRDIHLLPSDKVQRVLDIIEESGFSLPASANGEVELDIESLDYETVQRLRKYVTRHLPAAAAAANAAMRQSSLA